MNLKHYVTNRMKMSAIYQPVIILNLLQSCSDTQQVGAIALEISQKLHGNTEHIDKYIKKLKIYPKQVLLKNGVAELVGDGFKLLPTVEEMTKEERSEIINICHSKIKAYLNK